MKGTKFKGRWRELKESYRLPLPILKEANKFANIFLPDIGLIPEAVDNSLFDPKLLWRDISNFDAVLEKIFIAFQWLTRKHGFHPSEIVILIQTHKEGLIFKNYFKMKKDGARHLECGMKAISKIKFNKLLKYNPNTGVFVWKSTGKIAGTLHNSGYSKIKVLGKSYLAHRIALVIMEGKMPNDKVDHIKMDKLEKRSCNLHK
mgnify:CR=1 FL=1